MFNNNKVMKVILIYFGNTENPRSFHFTFFGESHFKIKSELEIFMMKAINSLSMGFITEKY